MKTPDDSSTTDLFNPIIRKGDSVVPPAGQAERERDEALARVSSNAGEPWVAFALKRLREFAANRDRTGLPEFIGEEFRVWYTQHDGWPLPHHHNAWGALTRSAATQGWLQLTGRMASMATAKSHARKSPTWIMKGDQHGNG